MKALLLTAFDDVMAPLGNLTAPLMLDYASKQRFDFRCVRTFPDGKPAYWHKMLCVVEAFKEGYDRIIWLDADQKITNPEIIPPGNHGFNASQDWGVDSKGPSEFSMCGFSAFRDSLKLFEWVIDNEFRYIDKPFPEQAPMRELYKTPLGKCIAIHPRRAYNSVPIQVHPSVVEPWQPGDWCCHITMLNVPERIKIFHEITN